MCGIVAIVSQKKPVSDDILKRAIRALEHRGPDGHGIWISPDAQVGLGHTRLSIVDPTSTQPIANEDGQNRIIANGEFYDFESIRTNLESRGHHFRTRNDSEIALHLYEDMQSACLEDLRGEFAFVVWDAKNETLFAARDRFGIKPLFYVQIGEILYLASEVKALFAAGVQALWDHDSVFQSLYASSSLDRTLFQGISQVPPGHFLLATREGVRLESYWDITYPRKGNKKNQVPAKECVEHVHHLLDESIRLRMRADVPVGYLLSGGLDSSTTLGLASSYSDKPLTAFTISFNDKKYDESPGAREMAEHANANHHVIDVSENELADHFADSVWHGETIQYNAHGPARFLLSQAIRQAGYKAVMGGEGADEIFAGYGFVQAAVLTKSPSGILPNWLRPLLRLLRPKNQTERLIAHTSPWLAHLSKLFEQPSWLSGGVVEWLELMRSIIAADYHAEFQGRDPYRVFFRNFDFSKKLFGRESAKQIIYVWLRSLFVNYHLAADRLDMAHSVEVRLPFLDHKLFEFASQIPVSLLAKGGQQKYVLREVGRPYITDNVRIGAKKPFWAPPSTLREGNKLYELTQDTLRGSVMASVPFFDQAAVIALLEKIRTPDEAVRGPLDPILMMMVSMCFLHERFRL